MKTEQTALCACGCGEEFTPFDKRGRPRKFIYGHWSRIQPHQRERVHCTYCDSEILRPQWHLRKGMKHHFCNQRCEGAWSTEQDRRKGENNGHYNTITVPCAGCTVPVSKPASLINRRNNKVYCPTCIPKYLRKGRPGFYVGYPKAFTPNLRTFIRNRDNHECQNCGKHTSETGTLHVHHIDYDKQNCSKTNLIALCRTCHGATNFALEVNKAKFQKMMAERFSDAFQQ